jgi:uncharacterized protein
MSTIFRDVLLAFFLILLVSGSVLALKPERKYPAKPIDYGIVYQEVGFVTSDGLKLKGWFFPAQDTVGINNHYVGWFPVPDSVKVPARPYRTLDARRHPTIIVPVADAGNMSYTIIYAYHFATRGFNVLTFDWRGFGESADWPIDQDELCYSQFLLDYDAAIDYVRTRAEVDTSNIGVFGYSTSAYLSFAIAAKRSDIRAFAGRGLITSFADVIPTLNKLFPERPVRKRPAGYPAELEPINAAPIIASAVFLVVGEKDDRTPPWMSQKVLSRIHGAKELWIVPNAEHGGMDAPEYKNYPAFFVRLSAWYHRHLGM